MMRLWALILAIVVAATTLQAQPAKAPTTRPAASAPAGPVTRTVIVSGLGGSKAYSRNLLDWVKRAHAVLTGQCGLRPEHVVVLTEEADPAAKPPRARSTLANFRATMEQMAKTLGPDDQFVLILLGHGQINEPVGKLCLPGPDLKADALADMLDALPTAKIVMINAASGGAEFIKTCAAEGRVLITGAGAEDDGNQTYFAEFFLRGYETGEADANRDKVIDLAEAYCYAARATANFYHRQYLVNTGGTRDESDPLVWYVRGKNTRAIWRKLYAGTKNTLGMPRTSPGEDPPPDPETEPDAEPIFRAFGPHWHNRRVLAEHARLDDNGGKKGFYLWQPYEFTELPDDEPGAVGFLTRRTVLGRTELLKRAAGAK